MTHHISGEKGILVHIYTVNSALCERASGGCGGMVRMGKRLTVYGSCSPTRYPVHADPWQ